MIRTLIPVIALLSVYSTTAETVNDTLRADLKEVTVVATRTEQQVSELPRSVTVLDRSDLEALPYLSLGNLLEEQAGLYLVGTGQAPGSNQSLFLRGGNTNQTAIFIDGIRLQDVSTVNGVADLSELPLESVDRIEILRGAQGTLFGSPASGGVINITTNRRGNSGWGGVAGIRGGIYQSGGWAGGLNTSLTGRSASGFYGRLDMSGLLSGGFNATIDTAADVPSPDSDGFRKGQFHSALGFMDDVYDVGLTLRRTGMLTDIDRQAYQDDDNYSLDFGRTSATFHFARKFSESFDMRLNSGWSRTDRIAVNDSSLLATGIGYDRVYTRDEYSGEQLTTELTSTYRSEHWSAVAGAGLLQESMSQSNYFYSAAYDPFIYEYEYDLDTVNPLAFTSSAFIHATFDGVLFGPSLAPMKLIAGSRYQNNTICGSNLAFDASALWMLDDGMIFFISYSTGFTTPSLYQQFAPDVYIPWDGTSYVPVSLGNKNLRPETTRALEAGIRQESIGEWNWELSVFSNRTNNLIDFVYLWNGSVSVDELITDPTRDDYRGATYENLGTQTVYGAEFSFSRWFGDNWKAELSGCIIDGFLEYDGRAAADARLEGLRIQLLANGEFIDAPKTFEGLVRRPVTFRAALHHAFSNGPTIRLQGRYIGARFDSYYDTMILPYGALNRAKLEGYVLFDLSGKWKLSERFSANCVIENLLNADYQEIRGFATRKIGVQTGLTMHF